MMTHTHDTQRPVTQSVLALAESGVLDWDGLARQCLVWMGETEVSEFARIHGYVEDTLE